MSKIEFQSKYREYLQTRKTSDSHRISDLREIMARILSEDDDSREWYEERLRSRGYGYGTTYGDVAIAVKDKTFSTSLAETTQESLKRIRCLRHIQEYLAQFPQFQFLVVGGSYPWKKFYSLNKSSYSDLDLLMVTDNYDKNINFNSDSVEAFIEMYLELPEEFKPDIMKFKDTFANINISLHWWTREIFNRVVNFDYAQIKNPFILSCLRADESSKAEKGYGPSYNFVGDPYYFDLDTQDLGCNKVSSQHVAMVGNRGELLIGVALDMILFCSECTGPMADEYRVGIQQIINKLKVRKKLEQQILSSANLSFAQLPCRKYFMPKFLLSAIAAWDLEIDD